MSFTASAPFGRKNSRSKINLFDACRISCFFASSFLVCDGLRLEFFRWSKKLRCARSSSSFFVQKHVQSKKLEVIRSGSSFFGQQPVQSKKLRCARSSSRFFVKKVIQSKKLEGDPFKLEFFRLNAPEDGIVEFFRPDWLPKGPRAPGGQKLSNPN